LERLETAGLDEIIETDTREVIRDKNFAGVLSVAELLAKELKKPNEVHSLPW
jgi:hypothetical protein